MSRPMRRRAAPVSPPHRRHAGVIKNPTIRGFHVQECTSDDERHRSNLKRWESIIRSVTLMSLRDPRCKAVVALQWKTNGRPTRYLYQNGQWEADVQRMMSDPRVTKFGPEDFELEGGHAGGALTSSRRYPTEASTPLDASHAINPDLNPAASSPLSEAEGAVEGEAEAEAADDVTDSLAGMPTALDNGPFAMAWPNPQADESVVPPLPPTALPSPVPSSFWYVEPPAAGVHADQGCGPLAKLTRRSQGLQHCIDYLQNLWGLRDGL